MHKRDKYINLFNQIYKFNKIKYTLNQIGNGNKFYYHGSDKKLTILKPMPSKILDGESDVFATNETWLAIYFIAKTSDYDFELGHINKYPFILEKYPGAIDKLLKNKSGYLYYVNADHFQQDKRLGMYNHEFISKNNVKILKKIFIPDVYKALLQTKVNIITFDENMECIEQIIKYRKKL